MGKEAKYFQQTGRIQDSGQNAAELSEERVAPILHPVVERGGFKNGIQERAIVSFIVFVFSPKFVDLILQIFLKL